MATLTRTELAPGETYQGTPEQILAAIMGTFQQRVTGYISARLGYRDRQLAEDLTQETFIRLWRYYVAPGTAVDDRVFGLLATISRQVISWHYRRSMNHETATDFTDTEVPATRTLAGPLTEMPHLARLFAELESAKDALIPVAEAYRTAHRALLAARSGLRMAVHPAAVARCTGCVEHAAEAEQGALDAFKGAAETVAALRSAWDAAAGAQSALAVTR
ncbi:RNA polymerase sigma factor [Streptacidiphilus sp. PAMC 29251]